MIDLRPESTPLGDPVHIAFEFHDRGYVVDYSGAMYVIIPDDPDPELWTWQLVTNL